MSQKPCIECEKDCDIFPVQLGDSFTLTYLRICSPECMFNLTYDFLYEIGSNKDFRNKLYDLQNEEDEKLRDEFIDSTTKAFLDDFGKHLEANPKMLSMPMPQEIFKTFSEIPHLPDNCGTIMRFTRPSKEDKIKWQKAYVEKLKADLEEAIQDLEKVENE